MSSTAPQLRSRLPRIAEVAVQRARLTVVPRPRTRPRAPRVPFVTLISVLLLGGVIGLLLFNTSMQQASFRATALEQQAADLTAQEEALRLEVQGLSDPRRILEEAQQAGMVVPQSACVLDVASDKVSGECTPALAGPRLPLYAPGPQRPSALDPVPVRVRDNAGRNGVPNRARLR